MTKSTAEARYLALAAKRDVYLRRAQACSQLTLPALIPENPSNNGDTLPTPAQSNGAQGVNSLAAKILLALMPPNLPVFRLETNDVAATILEGQSPEAEKAAREVRKNLDRIPRAALLLTETYAHRPVVFEAIKHLIVGGNALLWFMMDGNVRAVPLSRYVVLRDSLGFVLEVIIRDGLSASNLPPNLQEILQSKKTPAELLKEASTDKSAETSTSYFLYTKACWDPERRKYLFQQEFMDEVIEDTKAAYTKENFPLSPLRFSAADCEDYGRGLVEEYMGVLTSIEAISQAETALAIGMAELKIGVSAASGIRARDLQNAPTGSYLDFEPDTIKAIELGKNGDLAAVGNSKTALQRDFGLAFLVNTAIQRSGERVTAEEIRTMMQLLDSTLGGLYSSLSAEFQKPYVAYQLRLLKKEQGINIGKSGAIRPRIVTGIEALGKSSEAQQFFEAQKVISELVGPAVYGQRVKVDALADKINSFFNIEAKGIYKTDEEVQAEVQQAQQAEENKAAVAPIIGAATQVATQ